MQTQNPVINNPLSSSRLRDARAILKVAFNPIAEILDGYLVPDEKMNAVIEYAMKILVDHKDMKPARIARKTVEYFKLKKKINEANKV